VSERSFFGVEFINPSDRVSLMRSDLLPTSVDRCGRIIEQRTASHVEFLIQGSLAFALIVESLRRLRFLVDSCLQVSFELGNMLFGRRLRHWADVLLLR
jgi:hypothetical protein